MKKRGITSDIVTEIILNPGPFYFAENEHQQYLAKKPKGYCSMKGQFLKCRFKYDDDSSSSDEEA